MQTSPPKRESCSCCHCGDLPGTQTHVVSGARGGLQGSLKAGGGPASCSAQNSPKEAEGGRGELMGLEGNFHPSPHGTQMSLSHCGLCTW